MVDYSYDPLTGQLAGWDATQAGPGVTNRVRKAFEPARGLVAAVSNSVFAGGVWSPVSCFDYANDALGRRTARTDKLAGVANPLANVFAYNARSEVESAQMWHSLHGYEYDAIGNRHGGVAINSLNQLVATGGGALAYDLDGNLSSREEDGWNCQWDAENRLVAMWYDEWWEEEPGVVWYSTHRVEYRYDHRSRRIAKAVLDRAAPAEVFDAAPWSTNSACSYLYDGWNVIREGPAASQPSSANHYVWGLDISGSLQGAGGVGGLVAAFRGSPLALFPTYDGNGNVTELIDANGVRRARYGYGPFGTLELMDGDKAWEFPYRFSTKPYDDNTYLYYYGYRWYDPWDGRWLSRDPIEEDGGLNLYGFVGNGPISAVDPVGLASGNRIPPSASSPVASPTQPWRSGGQASFNPAKDVMFNGQVIGTVQVYKDANRDQWDGYHRAYVTEFSNGIWLEFHRSQNSVAHCLNCHWLQFVLSRYYDANGNEVPVSGFVAQGANVIQRSGQRYLDSLPSSAWYPAVQIPDGLAMFDVPGTGLNAKICKRVSDFDSFLVCEFQRTLHALFHVTWRMTQQMGQNRIYDNITGTSISQLPSWASGEQWLRGYDGQGQPVYVQNPLSSNP